MFEKLKEARERYKPGDWIMPTNTLIFNEPLLIQGRIQIADHFYGICHDGLGAIWSRNGGWAEIVERPTKSTIYKL